jgi:hypothetical protein
LRSRTPTQATVRAAETRTEKLERDGATMLDGVRHLLSQATMIE